jgi:hypothetical protein
MCHYGLEITFIASGKVARDFLSLPYTHGLTAAKRRLMTSMMCSIAQC